MDTLWAALIGGVVTIVASVLSFAFGRRRAESESLPTPGRGRSFK